MKIVNKSVKFGDCNIIYGDYDSKGLLIDCGSDNRGNGLCASKFAFSSIENEIKGRKIENILISHFHRDHFNGILEIPDSYRIHTAYLPYCIIDGKIPFLIGMGRLLAFSSSNSWGFKLCKDIIALFNKVEAISSYIRFLKREDHFCFCKEKIRVLWPEVKKSIYDSLPVKRTYHIPYFMGGEELLSVPYINIEEWLNRSFSELTSDDQNLLVDEQELIRYDWELNAAMEHFNKTFSDYLVKRHENDNTDLKSVNEALHSLSIRNENFRNGLSDSMRKRIDIMSRQQYHSLITCLNGMSVIIDLGKRFAFLGDAPAEVIDHINTKQQLKFNNQYSFVKLQHHGTNAHFTVNTPEGKWKVISNGGHCRRKVSGSHVSGSGIIICTNAHKKPSEHCEYYIKCGGCSPTCRKVFKEHSISV